MSNEQPTFDESLTGRIDSVCDSFEKLWREGKRPEIEEFVSGWAEPGRSALLRELLAVELEFLRILDATITRDDYCARFPDDVDLVADVFGESPTMTTPGDDQASTIVVAKPDSRSEAPPESAGVGGAVGDYEIQEEIARGGMGVVYKARQTRLNRIVALKMIKAGELAGDEEIKRFHAEAEAAAKLDHPGIVPIYEVGEWRTGGSGPPMHFFSMGFVEGRSLADRLKVGPLAPKDGAAMLKAIAEAVQYAHDKGIVHRDLKPANVLLADDRTDTSRAIETEPGRAARDTSDSRTTPPEIPAVAPRLGADQLGSPRITDFGLAKNIAADSGMTATGQILGTPSYMPPEQASGRLEDVGPRSDVYSLGAMLYAVLTGRPPFQAANAIETLKQVTEREPVSPAQLNPAVDRDLETICLKCLEKDVVKRYASARDFAADLSRYLEGKPILARPVGPVEKTWRWCRRNRALSGVGGVALALLMTLAIGGPLVAARQLELRGQSEFNARQAKAHLSEYKIEKERADSEASRVKTLLASEQAAVRKLTKSLDDNLKTINRWVATTKNAQLLREPRFKPLLTEYLKHALQHYSRFIEDYRDDQRPPMRLRLARALREIGFINNEKGSKADAVDAYLQATEVYRRLALEFPSVSAYQYELALNRNNLGNLYVETGRAEQALKEFHQALTTLKKVARENPEFADGLGSLANIYNSIGNVYRELGNPQKALEAHRQAVTFQQQLAQATPTDNHHQERLAVSFNNIGALYHEIRKPANALAEYQKSLGIREALLRKYPDSSECQAGVADVLNNIGAMLRETGQQSEALRTHLRALSMQEKLSAKHPTVSEYRDDMGISLNSIGTLYGETGQLENALKAYRRALAIKQKLVDENPVSAEFQNQLAETHLNIGHLLHTSGKRASAMAPYRKALEIRQTLALEHPTIVKYQNNLATSLNNLAILYRQNNKPDEALKYHMRALTIQQKLTQHNPKAVDYQSELAGTYNNIGVLHYETGRKSEALKAWRRSLAIEQTLAQKHPTISKYLSRLAANYFNVSNLHRTTGRLLDAIRNLNQTIKLQQTLLKRSPQDSRARQALQHSYAIRAITFDQLARCSEAVRDWRDALKLDNGRLKNFIEPRLALSLARDGRHVEAVQLANRLLKSTESVDVAHGLAGVFVIAASSAMQDDSLSGRTRVQTVSRYRNTAFAALRGIANSGAFRDPRYKEKLRDDPNLNALRHRDDFRKFAKSVGIELPAWARRPQSSDAATP